MRVYKYEPNMFLYKLILPFLPLFLFSLDIIKHLLMLILFFSHSNNNKKYNTTVCLKIYFYLKIFYFQGVLKEVDSHSPALRILDQSYSRLHKESWLEPDNLRQLTAPVRDLLQRWHNLTPDCNIILQKLLSDLQVYRDFLAIHGQAFESLTKLHVHLTEVCTINIFDNKYQFIILYN